jgi:hypothetical protein
MQTMQADMDELLKQLRKGTIQKAYRKLLDYIISLRAHFGHTYPNYDVSGSVYHGYMDMTYFPIFTDFLRRSHLKIAIVFNYNEFRFEAWLSGNNRKVQQKYWDLFRNNKWTKYHIVPTIRGADSIVECIVATDIDFDHLDALTAHIAKSTERFIDDIEKYLSRVEVE